MHRKHVSVGGENYLRSRSISEPEINFADKNCDRFKSKHFPFEYIPVDDLHYYRRRKPCNCKKNLFRSTLNLCAYNTNPVYKSEPNLNGLTEYQKTFVEKAGVGKLPPLKRPPYLKVDAYPFLTGLYKSDTSINRNYQTEYEQSYPTRPYSPRIGPCKRPPNIKLNPGVMDIRSEQKSQYLPYQADIVSRARPPAIRKPNNLHLIGNIELLPEYKTKFIPYTFDSINRANKVHCFHSKTRERKCKREQLECDIEEHRSFNNEVAVMEPKKLYQNNDYGARFHEKIDYGTNYMPEYRSKYRPIVGERSSMIPQESHFKKNDDDFCSTSEYNNQYKTYDHFTKSAPIKKEDNLYMKGQSQMQPEYKDCYKEIDYKSYVRQQPYRQANNLQSEGKFPTQMPEYSEKYTKGYNSNTMPERSKGREDYLQLHGNMEYDTLHRNNYVEFPRQRPIVKKPATHIKLSDSPREERKPENLNLPINVPYHSNAAVNRLNDNDEVPFECTPEYRKALKNYMIRERSPSRASPPEVEKKVNDKNNNVKITVDHNDVSKILTENKINVPEEKIVNEHNEVIVEPLKKPDGFKIPTRSPTSLNLGRGPTYPIDKDKFNELASVPRKPRKHFDVSFDDDRPPRMNSEDFEFEDENNNDMRHVRYEKPPPHPNHQHHPVVKKKLTPPKYGRRAPNPKEDYAIRKKTSVIEGNSTYARDFCSNRHEQKGFPTDRKTNALPFAGPPSDPLSNNYRPNYELDKQQSYREALGHREPFVVLDRELQGKNKLKQSGWMKKQWYDTN